MKSKKRANEYVATRIYLSRWRRLFKKMKYLVLQKIKTRQATKLYKQWKTKSQEIGLRRVLPLLLGHPSGHGQKTDQANQTTEWPDRKAAESLRAVQRSFYRKTPFYRAAFAERPFYTNTGQLLRGAVFVQRLIYTHRPAFPQFFLHAQRHLPSRPRTRSFAWSRPRTRAFTQSSFRKRFFCKQSRGFLQRLFRRDPFTHRPFTQSHSQTKTHFHREPQNKHRLRRALYTLRPIFTETL